MPYEDFTCSNYIIISDLDMNTETKRLLKNHELKNMHLTLLSMKAEKWYPITNTRQKELILALYNTGYYNNIEFDKYKSHIKITENEKAKN